MYTYNTNYFSNESKICNKLKTSRGKLRLTTEILKNNKLYCIELRIYTCEYTLKVQEKKIMGNKTIEWKSS